MDARGFVLLSLSALEAQQLEVLCEMGFIVDEP